MHVASGNNAFADQPGVYVLVLFKYGLVFGVPVLSRLSFNGFRLGDGVNVSHPDGDRKMGLNDLDILNCLHGCELLYVVSHPEMKRVQVDCATSVLLARARCACLEVYCV